MRICKQPINVSTGIFDYINFVDYNSVIWWLKYRHP